MAPSDVPMYTTGEQQQPHSSEDNWSTINLLPLPVKLFWFWYEATFSIVLSLTLLYWTLIRSEKQFATSTLSFSYINDHGGLFILLVIDFCYSQIPFRILHYLYILILVTVYLVVTVIYNFASGKAVYPDVLDWKEKPGWSAVYSIGAMILMGIAQMVFYGLCRLRSRIKKTDDSL